MPNEAKPVDLKIDGLFIKKTKKGTSWCVNIDDIDIFCEQLKAKVPKPNWKVNAIDAERQFYINARNGRWFMMVPVDQAEEDKADDDPFTDQF